jgi:hypothetical protein
MTELPSSEYFFTLALLSISFVGFGVIVVTLRQATGKPLLPFHVLLTRVFIELGIMAAAFALLAPTLALSGLPERPILRITSGVMLVVLASWLCFYPVRRHAANPEKYPPRVYVMLILGVAVCALLFLNAIDKVIATGLFPLAIATLYILSFASVAFIATYSAFLRD